MRVLHVISSLDVGGAQGVLLRLLQGSQDLATGAHVVSLAGLGPIGRELQASGIRVTALRLRQSKRPLQAAAALHELLTDLEQRPDLVQTWMYHSDLIGGVVARLSRIPVIWGIREGDPRSAHLKVGTAAVVGACIPLSRIIPNRIVCCSEASRVAHTRLGYDGRKMLVIPNGFDGNRFRPCSEARKQIRSKLGISPGTFVIGMAARWHPKKDHRTLLEAVHLLSNRSAPPFAVVLVGEGVDHTNQLLRKWIDELGLAPLCHLLGLRQDVAPVTAALDLALCVSLEEGFPNTVGEAMCCSVPCVATDSGDARQMIRDDERIVPRRDPKALADAIERILRMTPKVRRSIGARDRKRALSEYSMEQCSRSYSNLYGTVVSNVTER